MKKYILILSVAAAIIIAAASIGIYRTNNFNKKNDVQEIIKSIKNNRIEKINENSDDLKKLLYDYTDVNGGLSKEDVEKSLKMPETKSGTTVISKDDAVYDTEFLFKLLKYNYAGYKLNGGDEAFEKAKKNIMAEIENLKKDITINEYGNILSHNFNFINDAHFSIAYKHISTHYIYFTNEQYEFLKDKNGYYTYIKNKKYYLSDVNGKKPEEILKISIDSSGKVAYYPGILGKSSDYNIPVTLNLKFQKDIIKREIQLIRANNNVSLDRYTYNLKYLNGIPFVQIKSLASNKSNGNELKKFESDAVKLKKYNPMIIDLRGNGGGDSLYAENWYYNYTGRYSEDGMASLDLTTNSSLNAMEYIIKNVYAKDDIQDNLNIIKKMKESKGEKLGWGKIEKGEYKRIDNKNTIVVLTDSQTASSAENYIAYLRTLKNVIFIGSNTGGYVTCGNIYGYYLPHSNVPVCFGYRLFSVPGAEENKGFMPDIWLNPQYSIDRVVKFIKNYNLKDIEK